MMRYIYYDAIYQKDLESCPRSILGAMLVRSWVFGLVAMLPVLRGHATPEKPLVCIDPGHPSEVGVGTKGKKMTELFVAWDVAKRLEKLLQAEGFRVILTKQKEREFVRNRRRAEIANEAKAALLLRLHCDAAIGKGLATFYPDRQGRAEGIKGPSPAVIQQSKAIAPGFHRAVIEALRGSLSDRGLHTDIKTKVGARQGALTGSVFSKVPVLLVEMCVLNHAKDEAFVSTEKGRQKLAAALSSGVCKVLKKGQNTLTDAR